MTKYRKLAVVIDAEEYTLGLEDGFDLEDRPIIKTLEGQHIISDGDFIITGVKGERYPIKPDVFKMTYEKVEEIQNVCYHHRDMDGYAAGAIVKRFLGADTLMIDINYGEDWQVEDVKGRNVWVVDFSFPDMEKLAAASDSLTWIDHHGTAARGYWAAWQSDDIKGLRDLGASGCELTWLYCYPNAKMPNAIKWIGDRDIWAFKYPETERFYEGVSTLISDPDNELWDKLLDVTDSKATEEYIFTGADWLLAARKRRIDRLLQNAQEINLAGHSALIVNATSDISELGQTIYTDLGYELAVIFFFTKDGIKFSLRSNGEIDVSKIAELYGGGGHPGAAGFTVPSLEDFLNATKT